MYLSVIFARNRKIFSSLSLSLSFLNSDLSITASRRRSLKNTLSFLAVLGSIILSSYAAIFRITATISASTFSSSYRKTYHIHDSEGKYNNTKHISITISLRGRHKANLVFKTTYLV